MTRRCFPRGLLESAVDRSPRHFGQPGGVTAGVSPQAGERFVHTDSGSLGDDAFGLLDRDAADEGMRELVVDAVGLRGHAVLQHADRGEIGESTSHQHIPLVHRLLVEAEEVQGANGGVPEAQRERCGGSKTSFASHL